MEDNKSIKTFCFTLNNYTEQELDGVRTYCGKARYAVVGKEVGEQGTPHLQGYVQLKSPVKFRTLKNALPRAHIERTRGTAQQASDYCKEDGDFEEWGKMTAGKGARTDLDAFKDEIKAGMTYDQALEECSQVVARYPRFAKEYVAKVARDNVPPLEIEEFRPWQQAIMDLLAQTPHPRRIDWVVDTEGGKGKTYLAKHLVSKHGAFYTNGGKSTDIFYAYQGQRIVIFDFVRETQDFVNYGSIEAIKNGIMSSNKYESTLKVYNTPHIVVFANFEPAKGKLSSDRINLITI